MRASLFFLGFSVLFSGLSAPAARAAASADSEGEALLESLDIGRAAMAENPEAYSKALQKLSNSPPEAAAAAFGAETSRGESLFHLLARAKTHREFFAGEILYAAAFLSNKLPASRSSLYYWMIQNENKKGETPLETAKAADNALAYKNLMELEFMMRQEEEKESAAEQKRNYEAVAFIQAGILTSIGMIMLFQSSDIIMTGLGGFALAAGLSGAPRVSELCRKVFRKSKDSQ